MTDSNLDASKSFSCLKFEYMEWLTTNQAAQYLGISISRLHNLTSLGKIPYYKFGRSNRYQRNELRELLLSQPRGVRYGH
jgi:excisionase family DNA binding protein